MDAQPARTFHSNIRVDNSLDGENHLVEGLISILLDRSAPGADRDDAAMDLGQFDDCRAINALVQIGTDPCEDEIVLASSGESLAEIWLRTGTFDAGLLARLVGPAKTEADSLIRKHRPDWLIRGD